MPFKKKEPRVEEKPKKKSKCLECGGSGWLEAEVKCLDCDGAKKE
jgi:hypothetical protein